MEKSEKTHYLLAITIIIDYCNYLVPKLKVRIKSHSSITKSLDNIFYSNHAHQGYFDWGMRNCVFVVLLLPHSYQPQPHVPGYYAHSTLPRHQQSCFLRNAHHNREYQYLLWLQT